MKTIHRSCGAGGISMVTALVAGVWLQGAPAHAVGPPHSDTAAIAGADVDPPIALRGLVVDRAGRPIAGAAIEILDFADTRASGRRIATGADGRFNVAALARRSVLLRISQTGHYPEIVPVDLQRPVRTTAVSTGPIILTARAEGRARLMFVGDVMFGRRLVDDDQDGVEGETTDIIRPGKRADDARRAVTYVRDALASADYTVANLECVVTDNPATPHPYKPYTLYSHPDTLAGLQYAGVDGISSGNNHVFDYMAAGVADTIDFVAAAGLDDSGADMNESMARDTTIRPALAGVDVALQGLSEMRYDGADIEQYHLVARDPSKPGALYASPANLRHFLDGERDIFAVPLIHGGEEYSRYPTDSMRGLFVAAVAGGAGLVVSHHPHVLHGVGLVDGADARKFVLMSLGNFLFDQNTHETIDSVIAVVDVDALPRGGHNVARVELLPVVIDNYVPKLLAGEGLVRLGRKLAHLSTSLPERTAGAGERDGLRGAVVFPSGGRVVALKHPGQYALREQDQRVALAVHRGATDETAYARSGPADFLARVRTRTPATLELGRELLRYGDFEDYDVDGEVGEQVGWYLGPSVYTQTSVVRRGSRALALRRAAAEADTQALQTRQRVPIFGEQRLTVRGHVRGHAAGALTVRARFYADEDLLAEHTLHTEPGGTYGWTRFAAAITPPPGASGMHLSFRQDLPKGQVGTLYLDDLAVIQWEQSLAHAEQGVSVPAPNDWSFFRFTGVAGASLAATLTHRVYAAK